MMKTNTMHSLGRCTLVAQCGGGNPGREDEILITGENVYLYKL